MKDREPPPPPHIAPKVRLGPSEKVGLPFLFLLPILAVAGVFGPRTEKVEAAAGPLAMSVEYPARLRFENSERLLVRVRNGGASPVSGISLAFDPEYMHAFSPATFDPAPDVSYLIDIDTLDPGESRLVSVQLTADEYGPHRGWVTLSSGETKGRIKLQTFIFP